MANHASALKAHRQSITRRARNRSNSSTFRSALRNFTDRLADGKIEEGKAGLPQIFADIDSAVDKGVLSKNAASRHKSRLSKHLNAASATRASQ
jgi:small subunit ribosomal protein S20